MSGNNQTIPRGDMGSIEVDDWPVDVGADLRNRFRIKLICGFLIDFGELLWLGAKPLWE